MPYLDALVMYAVGYMESGRHVFLLGPSKRPVANCAACDNAGSDHDREACPCLTCHAFYSATTDTDRFADMLDTVTSPMLAIRTGAVSGIVVIDIDPGHGGAINADLMPRTAYVVTGSGGLHLYYRHPGVPVPNSQSRLAPGVDVRGDGGYVVAPPSIHPRTGQPYRWPNWGGEAYADSALTEMPSPLLGACLPPAAAVSTGTRPTTTTTGQGISDPDALLTAILTRVTTAPEGVRRTTLYGAARGVARMVAAGCLTRDDAWRALTAAGEQAQQTAREIRRAIEGGFTAEGVRP